MGKSRGWSLEQCSTCVANPARVSMTTYASLAITNILPKIRVLLHRHQMFAIMISDRREASIKIV